MRVGVRSVGGGAGAARPSSAAAAAWRVRARRVSKLSGCCGWNSAAASERRMSASELRGAHMAPVLAASLCLSSLHTSQPPLSRVGTLHSRTARVVVRE